MVLLLVVPLCRISHRRKLFWKSYFIFANAGVIMRHLIREFSGKAMKTFLRSNAYYYYANRVVLRPART